MIPTCTDSEYEEFLKEEMLFPFQNESNISIHLALYSYYNQISVTEEDS